jgi:hypothetical protein
MFISQFISLLVKKYSPHLESPCGFGNSHGQIFLGASPSSPFTYFLLPLVAVPLLYLSLIFYIYGNLVCGKKYL